MYFSEQFNYSEKKKGIDLIFKLDLNKVHFNLKKTYRLCTENKIFQKDFCWSHEFPLLISNNSRFFFFFSSVEKWYIGVIKFLGGDKL
jgi:hypothetical protein